MSEDLPPKSGSRGTRGPVFPPVPPALLGLPGSAAEYTIRENARRLHAHEFTLASTARSLTLRGLARDEAARLVRGFADEAKRHAAEAPGTVDVDAEVRRIAADYARAQEARILALVAPPGTASIGTATTASADRASDPSRADSLASVLAAVEAFSAGPRARDLAAIEREDRSADVIVTRFAPPSDLVLLDLDAVDDATPPLLRFPRAPGAPRYAVLAPDRAQLDRVGLAPGRTVLPALFIALVREQRDQRAQRALEASSARDRGTCPDSGQCG